MKACIIMIRVCRDDHYYPVISVFPTTIQWQKSRSALDRMTKDNAEQRHELATSVE